MPAAWCVIAIAAALHLAVVIDARLSPEENRESLRRWGAAVQLIKLYPNADGKLEPEHGFTGQFELWDGELWRIPVSAFHHGDLLHLLMNSLAIGLLGWFLEPRLGHWRFLRFFLTATLISMLPEFLAGRTAVGLSGGAYALFGLLLVLRTFDERLAAAIPASFVQWGILWLFLGILLNALELMRIANLAHFAGFIYGWIYGQVRFGKAAVHRGYRWAFWGSHLLLVPALWFICQPVWNGRYWWYRADACQIARARETNEEQKQMLEAAELKYLKTAVSRDPGLGRAWRQLAVLQLQQGQLTEAWRSLLTGIDYNRSDPRGIQFATDVWHSMRTLAERQIAVDGVKEKFGADAERWITRLGMRTVRRFPVDRDLAGVQPPDVSDRPRLFDLARELLSAPWNSGEPFARLPKHLAAPDVDPHHPASAQPDYPDNPSPLRSGTTL